jgi:pyridinium-3,5-bisthiocarboxylic acid mononucleotide nickel chelatase
MSTAAWFHCGAGTAGDMTLASLIDAGADSLQVIEILGGLALDDYALMFERTQRAGVGATRAIVAVHDHDDHDHDDHDHDDHRAWRDIKQLLIDSELPARVRERALKVFAILAEVEANIHGVAIDDIEFHEVGSVDAIVDIVGVCAALEVLNIDRIFCSNIAVGHGHIKSAHGTLPNPAPAVTALAALRGVTLVGLDDHRELATPTGVALMVALADSFGAMPPITVSSVGYGAGTNDISGRANVVKVVIGETLEKTVLSGAGQDVQLLEANVDDVSGEVIAHTIAELLTAGAHDAWATPIVMKKGRPAFTVHALCDLALTEKISAVLVSETGTLGLRGSVIQRWPQTREEKSVIVHGHTIRIKIGSGRIKVENDDAVTTSRALSLPLREVLALAEQAARQLN